LTKFSSDEIRQAKCFVAKKSGNAMMAVANNDAVV
jgi:hypothetical protein